MISKDFWKQDFIKESINEIVDNREKSRSVYMTENGINQLIKIIKSGHIFETIDSDYFEANSERNFVINILTEMGFLDEGNIESIVRYMLTLPVVPDFEI